MAQAKYHEPFIGSGVEQAMAGILTKYAELYAARYGETDPAEMIAAWMEPERKQAALRLLEDAELFQQVVDAPSPVLQAFEATALSALYRKAAAAIRETDLHGMLFVETNYFSNLGTRSMIEPVIGLAGIRDEQQVYAPHAYDLVTDTELAHTANDARLELILTRHKETRQRLEMPLLVGEWGAFYGSRDTGHVSLYIQRLQEKLLRNDTYWGLHTGYGPQPVLPWRMARLSDGEGYMVQPIEGSTAGYMIIPPVQWGNRSLIIAGKQPEG
ncbi:cellulase family glycosylhydrolase [Paenibacillus thiaminolyticus]|uniref:cellulase family glycosylhydrolase n=1 Tax=Paenibacillus thiaminolyticus TaxID=49283 RepID=UPI0035A58D4D